MLSSKTRYDNVMQTQGGKGMVPDYEQERVHVYYDVMGAPYRDQALTIYRKAPIGNDGDPGTRLYRLAYFYATYGNCLDTHIFYARGWKSSTRTVRNVMMASRVASGHNSSPHPTWPARSHVALYVRCLHLLDLDLLEDWPGINEELFASKTSQQTLQQRVKAVEWSLYRLFELSDPNETKDKLRPFFPPTTQLQSLNLRAALYRCLTELKKNGVLGKDAVMRKTMLDDCKGERFEEVLTNFAMSVLKRRPGPLMGLTENVLPDTQLLPAVLSYRVSIQSTLRSRKEAATRARDEEERLEVLAAELQKRLEAAKSAPARTDAIKQRELRSLINSNWMGETTWADVLLSGVPDQSVLHTTETSCLALIPDSAAEGLISKLNKRLKLHQDRLCEWRTIAKDLKLKRKPEETSAPSASQQVVAAASLYPRFTQHQSLNLDDRQPQVSMVLPRAEPYVRLLEAMRQELSNTSMAKESTKAEAGTFLFSSKREGSEVQPNISNLLVDSSGPRQSAEDLQNDASLTLSVDSSFSVLVDDDPEPSVSPSPLRSSDGESPWIPKQQSVATTVDEDRPTPAEDSVPPGPKAPGPPMSPSSLWMSLADRTRASMNLTSHQSVLPDPDLPDEPRHMQHEDPAALILHSSLNDNPHVSLLERTRQSMSMISNSSGPRRKAKPEQRLSQSFPVNQFETPGRAQRFSEVAPSSGASTPRDTLFEEDADYASIFKSRPKLAMSPTLSPQRRTSGLDSIVEQEMDGLNLSSDEDID